MVCSVVDRFSHPDFIASISVQNRVLARGRGFVFVITRLKEEADDLVIISCSASLTFSNHNETVTVQLFEALCDL
jgi:hypothetical protein